MTQLQEFILDLFGPDNEVKTFISERGNQRVEIKDTLTEEVWQTLEAVSPQEDMSDFTDIEEAVISSIL